MTEISTKLKTIREVIRPIPGHDGYYVDICGDVWSCKTGTMKRLLLGMCSGYKKASLFNEKRYHYRFAHHLVLETFIGPRPVGYETSHLNGVRLDNRLENLVWSSRKENHSLKKIHGTHQTGEHHGRHKLTLKQVTAIRRDYKRVGYHKSNARKLALRYGVDKSIIHRIVNNSLWKDQIHQLLGQGEK